MSILRFYPALYGGKLAALIIKILGRKGTYFPGVVNLKIDPDFLSHIKKPDKIIAVTGTNRKTTTSNKILDILRNGGNDPVNNSLGSNTIHGVLTALSSNIGILGNKKNEIAVLEIDERYTPKIFKAVQPNILVITNIFQDSYRRNAHTDFIKSVIESGIDKNTKIIVNGDDLIASNIGCDDNKICYGIDRLSFETYTRESRLKDLSNCPICGTKLTWDFNRYHHIGRTHCEKCGFKNKEIKYRVTSVDFDNMTFTLEEPLGTFSLPLINKSLEGLYNQLASYSTLREYGMEAENIIKLTQNLNIVESRFKYKKIANRNIYSISAKGLNPIANSRVFDTISRINGTKCIVVMNDQPKSDLYKEMLSWLYDADFEYLNQDELSKLIFISWKGYDLKLRALMAGIDEDKIFVTNDEKKVISNIDMNSLNFIFLHDIEDPSVEMADRLINELSLMLEEDK